MTKSTTNGTINAGTTTNTNNNGGIQMENKNINLTVMRTMEEILDSIFNKYGDKLSGDKLAELASQEFNLSLIHI